MSEQITTKVIGYRSWKLTDEGVLCASGFKPEPWSPGVFEATCKKHEYAAWQWENTYGGLHHAHYARLLREDVPQRPSGEPETHVVPDHDCSCGIHARHDLPDWNGSDDFVFGAVSAWGRVEVHADGFRAQYAQPVVLSYGPESTVRMLRRIEEYGRKHGLKVVPSDQLIEYASAYGEPVPEQMRPERNDITAEDAYLRHLNSVKRQYRRSAFGASPSYASGAGQVRWSASVPFGYAPLPKPSPAPWWWAFGAQVVLLAPNLYFAVTTGLWFSIVVSVVIACFAAQSLWKATT